METSCLNRRGRDGTLESRDRDQAAILRRAVLELLPHINAVLNAVVTVLVVAAFLAVRRGDRVMHARLMKSAVGVGVFFAVGYVTLTVATGHQRFPGRGTLRTLFLTILVTHIILAVAIVPMIARSIQLAVRDRIDEHRRWVRFTLPAWLYVCVTGLVIYGMNTFTHG
jgi:putative membrane protein